MKETLTVRRGKKTQTHTFTWLQHSSVASLWPCKSQGEAAILFCSMGATSGTVGWAKWSQSQGLRSFQPPLEIRAYISLFRKCTIAQVINMQIRHRCCYVSMCCLPSNLYFTYRENTEDLQIHMKITFKCLQLSKPCQVFVSPLNV